MIVGLGTDVVDCARLRRVVDRYGARFIERVFTEHERDYCLRMRDPVPHLAARFAAKEAARKALAQAPPLGWHDVEVVRSEAGPIALEFHGDALKEARRVGVRRSWVSLSHELSTAVATVVLED